MLLKLEHPLTKYSVLGEEDNIKFEGELTLSYDNKIHDLWISFKQYYGIIGSFFTTETRNISETTKFNCIKKDLYDQILNLANKIHLEILNKLKNEEILF